MNTEIIKDGVIIKIKNGQLRYQTIGGQKISQSEANENILAVINYWDKLEEQERKQEKYSLRKMTTQKPTIKLYSIQNQHG